MVGVGGTTTFEWTVSGEAGCSQMLYMVYAQPWRFENSEEWFMQSTPLTRTKVTVVKAQQMLSMARNNVGEDGIWHYKVKKGTMATLKLSANATTGYRWMIKDEKKAGKCLGGVLSSYRSDPYEEGMTGVGGKRTFTWEVTGEKGCKQDIYLFYAQPWNFPGWAKVLERGAKKLEFVVQ